MKNAFILVIAVLFGCQLTYAQQKKVTQKNAVAPPLKTQQKSANKSPIHPLSPRTRIDTSHIVQITTDSGVIQVKLYNQTPLHRDNFIKLVKQGFYDSLLFHRVIKTFMIQGGDPQSKNADSLMSLGNGDVGYKIPAEIMPELYHKRGALAAARDNNPEKASSGCQFYIVQGKRFTLKEMEQIINNRNLMKKQEMLYKLFQTDTVQAAVNALQNSGNKEASQAYMLSLQKVVDDQYNKAKLNVVNYDQIDDYMMLGGAPHLDGEYTVFGEVISGMEVVDKIADMPTRASDNRPVTNIHMKMKLLK